MKNISLANGNLIFFILFFTFLQKVYCDGKYTAFFSSITSNPIGIVSNWIENPLNLSYLNTESNIFFAITPSKFFIPELNVSTLALATKKFKFIYASTVAHIIYSNVFSNYFLTLSFNKPILEKYNIAARISTETISIKGFRTYSTYSTDIYFEYLFDQLFRVGCAFKNLMSGITPKIFSFGASYVVSDIFLIGLDANIYINRFNSYNFFSALEMSDIFRTEIMYSSYPSTVNISSHMEISDLVTFILSFEYHTQLGLTQTFAIQICF